MIVNLHITKVLVVLRFTRRNLRRTQLQLIRISGLKSKLMPIKVIAVRHIPTDLHVACCAETGAENKSLINLEEFFFLDQPAVLAAEIELFSVTRNRGEHHQGA